jgi:hypothetical protein
VWSAPRRTTPGGQPVYSDLAIEMCLTLRMVFKQALRQTQGLMRSISKLMCVDITVPHFTTMSRRGIGLSLPSKTASKTTKPVQLVVDSTGLKIFGEGEWLEEKHKTKGKRRAWRKLHLGLDLVSGEIVCSDLTTDDIGDPTALPGLLDQDGYSFEKVAFRCTVHELTHCGTLLPFAATANFPPSWEAQRHEGRKDFRCGGQVGDQNCQSCCSHKPSRLERV